MPNTQIEFQTRSEESGLQFFSSLKDALNEAEKDKSIWKISFSLPNGERVRLVSHTLQNSKWTLEQMDELV